MSLVYDGGTILASKRVSYDDLAEASFDEKELAERVSRQHKLICAAVKAGRIDELKEMTAKSAAAVAKAKSKVEPVTAGVDVATLINVTAHEPFADEPAVEAFDIVEDDTIFPAELVAVVSELSGQERKSNTKLSIELLGDAKFRGGDLSMVSVMICRGTERKVVPDAQIMIKILGSSFRPVIFHAKSDSNGLAFVNFQIPQFQVGRAALLIRAMTGGEEVELRRIVMPG